MKNKPLFTRTAAFILIFLGKFASTLKISSFNVPDVIESGQTVKLSCQFTLEGDSLYSVTWWKGEVPFFRFQAGSSKFSVFQVPGIFVEKQRSNLNEVYLSHSSYKTSGKIGCEVVADSPSFEKDSKWGELIVVERQKTDPIITGNMEDRRMGDLLLINCSSSFSYPASILTWFINGKQASVETVIVYSPEDDGQGRKSSKSGLQMFLQSFYFQFGVLRLQWRSSILNRFTRYNEVQIQDPDYVMPSQEERVAISSATSTFNKWMATLVFIFVHIQIIISAFR